MQSKDPESVEDWLALVESCRILCERCKEDSQVSGMVWAQAGFAVECILKAAIHSKERLNRWPNDRPDLRTHNLKELANSLGLNINSSHPIAPAWATVIQWRRSDMYNPNEIKPRVLQGLLDAVFSEKGVIVWMRQNYLRNY